MEPHVRLSLVNCYLSADDLFKIFHLVAADEGSFFKDYEAVGAAGDAEVGARGRLGAVDLAAHHGDGHAPVRRRRYYRAEFFHERGEP